MVGRGMEKLNRWSNKQTSNAVIDVSQPPREKKGNCRKLRMYRSRSEAHRVLESLTKEREERLLVGS
jgi:hypothetical protein